MIEATVPEFRRASLAAVKGLAAQMVGDGAQLRWRPVADSSATQYQVRRGSPGRWSGAEVIEDTASSSSYVFPLPPGDHDFLVKARYGSAGLFSQLEAHVRVTWSASQLDAFPVILDGEFADAVVAGSHDGTELSGGELRLSAGETVGTWTSAPVAVAGAGRLVTWTAAVDTDESAAAAPSDDTDSVENLWLGSSREPSRTKPGFDLEAGHELDDLTVGENSCAQLEVRFELGGVWGAWTPFVAQQAQADRAQIRLKLYRGSLDVVRSVYRVIASGLV